MRRRSTKLCMVLFSVAAIAIIVLEFGYFERKWHIFEEEKKTVSRVNDQARQREHDRDVFGFGNTWHFPRESIHKGRGSGGIDADVDAQWLKITQIGRRHRAEFIEEMKNVGNSNFRMTLDDSLPPWFSERDVMRLQMMSHNRVLGLKPLPHRVNISRIVYDTGEPYPTPFNGSEIECLEQCAVVKTVDDIYEIFAFHLDRILGLNRSLPMVARSEFPKFPENPNVTLHDGKVRPVVWFEPNILHGGTYQSDQNTIDVSWPGYLRILKARCWDKDNSIGDSTICNFPIRLIEWSRMALLDFLIQNYDRLDRNCCGYHNVSEGERCFQKKFNMECYDEPEKLMLVHIMVRSTDTSRLVLIDNAGNPGRSIHALNYKLLAGLEELPEHSIAIIKSGLLRSMLRRSLYADKIYWEEMTEVRIDDMIKTIELRSKKLLDFMEEQKIKLVQDY